MEAPSSSFCSSSSLSFAPPSLCKQGSSEEGALVGGIPPPPPLSIPHGPVPSWRKSGESAENQYACFSSRSPSFLRQGLLFFSLVTSFPKPRPFPPPPPPSLPPLSFPFLLFDHRKGRYHRRHTHIYPVRTTSDLLSRSPGPLSSVHAKDRCSSLFPLPHPNRTHVWPFLLFGTHSRSSQASVRTRPVPSFSVYFEAPLPLLSAPEATPPPPAFSPPPPRRLRSQPGLWVFPLRRE